jgi:hypothetical protein
MSPTALKRLVLCAALALAPALSSAQGMTGNTTSPVTNPDQATRSSDDQASHPIGQPDANQIQQQQDRMAYQRELDACDRQPSEQDACRANVDAKHTDKTPASSR